jgi:Saccharopine dehydrogenase NADP binding domain
MPHDMRRYKVKLLYGGYMQRSVLILGGYGNFGKRIAEALTQQGIAVIIAGRSREKAEALVRQLPEGLAEAACFDVTLELETALQRWRPTVVVNTCGPFQNSDYRVAECCIARQVHYLDLADGRAFVAGITALDKAAKAENVAVISGASTVPGLSSAVIEHFRPEFASIKRLRYGISPGQKAERGLATTQGILSYVGKPLAPYNGQGHPRYGWQDVYRQDYPELGKRWMANCDIPDLDLFPAHYGIGAMHFSAGLELGMLHLGLWGLSWLVRAGVPLNLPRYAKPLLAISNDVDRFGSADGGMHLLLDGTDHQGKPHQRAWFIIARDGYGPYIPTIPAILLAIKLIRQELPVTGAMPCVGLVTLTEYLAALEPYSIRTFER